jgi:hypothetical protein
MPYAASPSVAQLLDWEAGPYHQVGLAVQTVLRPMPDCTLMGPNPLHAIVTSTGCTRTNSADQPQARHPHSYQGKAGGRGRALSSWSSSSSPMVVFLYSFCRMRRRESQLTRSSV